MPQGNVASSSGAMLEYVKSSLEVLTLVSSVLLKRFNNRTDVKPVSTRPTRIPFQPLTQGGMRIGAFDGQDLGLGSAPVETEGTLTCVPLLQASQYTFLSEWASDSTTKAVKSYSALVEEQSSEVFAGFIDSLIALSDGSNTLDSVVGLTGTNGVIVNNVHGFQDLQEVMFWSALNGTLRGNATIQSVDPGNNTLWFTAALPAGVIANDLILPAGSTGQPNTGINGLFYYNVAGNLGNFMGIQRSSFPGKFSTPNVNRGGNAMTTATVRALFAQIVLRLGPERANSAELVCHGNVEAQAAWENIALNVQQITMNEVKGDQITDMLTKEAPTTIAKREFIVNVRARPGRIDFLPLNNWFRIETRKTDLVDVKGQTAFPVIGESGGIASSIVSYRASVMQVGTSNPGLNAFYSNFAIPTGYFGH